MTLHQKEATVRLGGWVSAVAQLLNPPHKPEDPPPVPNARAAEAGRIPFGGCAFEALLFLRWWVL